MDTKSLTRKEFIKLTFTLIGSTALVGSSCDDDDDIVVTTGAGGRGGTTGSAGQTGAGGAAGTGGGGRSCSAPMVPDNLGHTHTLTVSGAVLISTTSVSFTTSLADGHQHVVEISAADLSTLSTGATVTVTSMIADGHVHMFTVTCT